MRSAGERSCLHIYCHTRHTHSANGSSTGMPVRGDFVSKLVHAAAVGDDAKVKRLLKANADVDAGVTWRLPPLYRVLYGRSSYNRTLK